MSKLTILANIGAKADKVDLVKSELLKLIALTRAEEGGTCDLFIKSSAHQYFSAD